MKYFSVHPNVGGTFNSTADLHDHKRHPVTFRFRTGSMLRKLIPHIVVEIEGIADTQGYIDEFIDIETGTVNETLNSGSQFLIHGHKIKVAGDDGTEGVYFVSADNHGTESKSPPNSLKTPPQKSSA